MNQVYTVASELDMAFYEFSKCIQLLGSEKTLIALKNLRFRETNVKDEEVSFVFETVTNVIGISLDEIFNSRAWSLDRVIAIGIITHVFFQYFDYSARKIEQILHKSKSACWKNMDRFKALNPKYEDEKRLIDLYHVIETNVISFKKNIKPPIYAPEKQQ